jgi:hypothetical protein
MLDSDFQRLPTGYRQNLASVGPALMWAPFFFVGHLIAHVLVSRGAHLAMDGYSWPYIWSCAAGSALYAFLGLWLAYRLALRYAAPGAALLATVLVWLASSLPVYLYFLPFHAHAVASFAVAWFLWNWIAVRDGGGAWRWLVWGLSAGLVTATHYINGVMLLVAAMEIAAQLVRVRPIMATIRRSMLFVVGGVAVLTPGVIIRWIIAGSPFATGYGGGLFFWRDPRLWQVAFAPEHGAILWTPVLALALVGLYWLSRRAPAVGIQLAVVTITFYYVVAAYQGWHGHSSYGNRFLTALTPIFVLGLAAFIDRVVAHTGGRRRWAAAWIVSGLLIAWNAGFMFQWGTNLIPNRGPVDMSVVVKNQVTVVPQAMARFLRRYFTSRGLLVREVEQGNAAGRGQYQPKR